MPKNPRVRRFKSTAEMRRAGVPDIIRGTSTLVYESGRQVPLTEHKGHFLSPGETGTALMHRKPAPHWEDTEYRVEGLHDFWGDRQVRNPKNPSAKAHLARMQLGASMLREQVTAAQSALARGDSASYLSWLESLREVLARVSQDAADAGGASVPYASAAQETMRQLRKALTKKNPAYRAAFVTDHDRKTVRKDLRAHGYLDVKVKGGGKKRAPGAYAKFMQEQMPLVRAKGFTVAGAMKEIGKLWSAKKGRKANPPTTGGVMSPIQPGEWIAQTNPKRNPWTYPTDPRAMFDHYVGLAEARNQDWDGSNFTAGNQEAYLANAAEALAGLKEFGRKVSTYDVARLRKAQADWKKRKAAYAKYAALPYSKKPGTFLWYLEDRNARRKP